MSRIAKSILQKICLVLLLIGVLATTKAGFSTSVRAASGMPDSSEFGYGARLDPWGQEVELAMNAASGIGMDWIGVDFDWSRHWPDPAAPVDFGPLDQVMALAQKGNLSISLAVTDPPAWALGPDGPDIYQTASLLVMLAKRYPGTLLTIELFPGANTMKGWGGAPDPAAYARLLQACQAALKASNSPVLLVAGGLSPLPAKPAPGDMDDLHFLSGLYQAGAAQDMPILGLRLDAVEGEAAAPPDQAAKRVLRHYEAVRQVMLTYGHGSGLIWVTGFTWPDAADTDTPGEQIRWLSRAYQLMKSQLYIGVAFIDRLNPPDPAQQSPSSTPSLITTGSQGTSLHPSLEAIGKIISLSRTGHASYQLFLYKKLTTGAEKRLLKRLIP
jgi:hypothetical protein